MEKQLRVQYAALADASGCQTYRTIQQQLNFCMISGQATSYLVTAWEALANKMDTTMEQLPVEFDDVSIVQAVPALAEDSVQLTVLLDASNHFQASL